MSAFPFFVARSLIARKGQKRSSTERILRFTVAGIALCMAVMLLAVFIGAGFSREVKSRLSLLTGDIMILPYGATANSSEVFFTASPSMIEALLDVKGVVSVRPVVQLPGILKTDSAFAGILAVGMDELSIAALSQRLRLDQAPEGVNDTLPVSNPALISVSAARNLSLATGEQIPFYTLGGKIAIRQVTVAGVTDIPEVNGAVMVVPIDLLRKLSGLSLNEVSRLEIFIEENANVEEVSDAIVAMLSNSVLTGGNHLGLNTARELMPALFDWIDMLNANTGLLLAIMAIVAGFTITTGLLVMMLGRIRMIGLLRALGASHNSIRELFLYLGGDIVLRGLLLGNVIAFALALPQYFWRIVSLDPSIYYISYVPLHFSFWAWLLVNIGFSLVTLLMIYLPTRIVARIKPTETLRFS